MTLWLYKTRKCWRTKKGRTDTHGGATLLTASQNGTYGLMSKTGVPSIKSAAAKSTLPWSMRLIWHSERPIGLGRWGVRVARTPMLCPMSLGGFTLPFNPLLVLLWCRSAHEPHAFTGRYQCLVYLRILLTIAVTTNYTFHDCDLLKYSGNQINLAQI
jgi:hypothetical protein